ncbi:MAG: NAD(P)-dependent glycerol-3-phosphate dehydrogenase [Desulfovibrio sp.]|nr:NAD(P)-dependent glycerol-3-phosphate dehydrogenase [Desulfovibrio sp.]
MEAVCITVAGGGSWGTALAHVIACAGHSPRLWLRDTALAEHCNTHHENPRYLPGLPLHESIVATTDPAVLAAPIVILAIPCQNLRSWLTSYTSYFSPGTIFCNVAKGIELQSLTRCSQIVAQTLQSLSPRYAILSGPSFAKEVMRGLPTAVVLAAEDALLGHRLRDLISCSVLRCYSSCDVIGVEMGGALKNVMAIAAGVGDGLDLGHNSRAALITRGLAEMRRLGVACGAHAETFMGLSGLGDLTLTCTGDLSRNRQLGLRLGQGERLIDIVQSLGMVAEGVATTEAAYHLAQKYAVDVPLTKAVYEILYTGRDPEAVLRELMARNLRDEDE